MNNFDILPFELQKLGLCEKESLVYLTALRLGNSSAQAIAVELKLSRPTAYRILEKLQKKKLVTKFEKSNRTYFSANSPERLLNILKIKRREAEEQEREFLRVISLLQSQFFSQNKNQIKIHLGNKGQKNLLETFSNTSNKNIRVLFFGKSSNKLQKKYTSIQKRLRQITIKELYCGKAKKTTLEYIQQKSFNKRCSAETIMIITDKIIVLEKNKGLLIENPETATIIKNMFELLWLLG